MSNDSTNTPQRLCPKCGQEKPLTNEYFARDKNRKSGFGSYCKTCKQSYVKNNLSAFAARQRSYRLADPERARETGRRCNFSKSSKLPAEWLSREFGQPNATKILSRINIYFELIK
jgi:hypothetical protein